MALESHSEIAIADPLPMILCLAECVSTPFIYHDPRHQLDLEESKVQELYFSKLLLKGTMVDKDLRGLFQLC